MPDPQPAPPVIFASTTHHARELAAADLPRLQALFEANPEYVLTINGRLPRPDEAQLEFDELPPPHLAHTRRWFTGLYDGEDGLIGVANVVSDLGVHRVWQIALFMVATRLHGQGVAAGLYRALEAWAAAAGARWLRLGVVEGNTRAERFWARQGFVEVRRRERVDTGGRINDVRVLVKPLGDATVAEHLERMPRDRPGSPLP